MVVFRQSSCLPEKFVVFGEKCLYSSKVVLFGKNGCNPAKVVVFGKKWLYSSKSGCIRE